jgi:hypothetical protein
MRIFRIGLFPQSGEFVPPASCQYGVLLWKAWNRHLVEDLDLRFHVYTVVSIMEESPAQIRLAFSHDGRYQKRIAAFIRRLLFGVKRSPA